MTLRLTAVNVSTVKHVIFAFVSGPIPVPLYFVFQFPKELCTHPQPYITCWLYTLANMETPAFFTFILLTQTPNISYRIYCMQYVHITCHPRALAFHQPLQTASNRLLHYVYLVEEYKAWPRNHAVAKQIIASCVQSFYISVISLKLCWAL